MPWTKQSIVDRALAEFAEDFQALPSHETLEFLVLDKTAKLLTQTGRLNPIDEPCTAWPTQMEATAVKIGTYDWEDGLYHGSKAYAYIHDKNTMGILLMVKEDVFLKVNPGSYIVADVEWDDPFAHVVSKINWDVARLRVRSLIVWFLVSSGHMAGFSQYKQFLKEFKSACQAVRAGRSLSFQDSEEEEGDDESGKDGKHSQTSKEGRVPWADQDRNPKPCLKRVRGMESPEQDSSEMPKKRFTDTDFGNFRQNLSMVNDGLENMYKQWRDENDGLREEIEGLKEEIVKLKSAKQSTAIANREDAEISRLRAELIDAKAETEKAEKRSFAQWKKIIGLEEEIEAMKTTREG